MEERTSFKMGAGALRCLGLSAALALVFGILAPRVDSIQCYKCNSYFDPACGDPFNPYTIGEVNCSLYPTPEHMPNANATLCRKTVQKVEGKVRVIRGCGYITDEDRDDKSCMRRTGTHEVQMFYCSCTSDLCNPAAIVLPFPVLLALAPICGSLL